MQEVLKYLEEREEWTFFSAAPQHRLESLHIVMESAKVLIFAHEYFRERY